MPDFLLELFSEEIPARMQTQAAKDLERLVIGALTDRGLMFEGMRAFAGSRRLTLAIAGLPVKQPDVSEEKKGPRVGAPEKAIEGFLRSAGITLDQCQKQNDGKGEFYVAVIARKGRATAEVLSEILPEVFAKLPWPKSMRWGTAGQTRWVRPLHGIVATFDGEVVPLEFANVKSGNITYGHRFLSKGPLEVRRFEDYRDKLKKAYVVLDATERKEIILNEIKQKAFALGLELIEDQGLLEEVAGLAEWPLALIGTIEDQFMDVPAEILQTSMRVHQKYFSLRDPKTGKMANRFAIIANMITEDGGKEIVAGNERVLRARLSDAKFFWDEDRRHTLESRVEALKGIVFHAKLGTQYERVERITKLAGEIAAKIGADAEKAKRAARLAKADLTTGVVGEFPELQGVMGRYYALHDGLDAEIADAVRDHYKPVGPSDAVPGGKVSIAVALADKIDQLAGFFLANERPTGSGDPYALRRAALGIVRIISISQSRLELVPILSTHLLQVCADLFVAALRRGRGPFKTTDAKNPGAIIGGYSYKHPYYEISIWETDWVVATGAFLLPLAPIEDGYNAHIPHGYLLDSQIQYEAVERLAPLSSILLDIVAFLADRLKVALKEKGIRHDLIDAVFSLGNEDDLVRLVARVEALQAFLKTEDGTNLLAGYKRAANILKIEEKKDGKAYDGTPKIALLKEAEEKALAEALAVAKRKIADDVSAENFTGAMAVMASLRKPVDAFFDKVKVNADDAAVRENRLLLLASLRAALHQVADFSKIEG